MHRRCRSDEHEQGNGDLDPLGQTVRQDSDQTDRTGEQDDEREPKTIVHDRDTRRRDGALSVGTGAFRLVDRDIEDIADQTSRHTAMESSRFRGAPPAESLRLLVSRRHWRRP
ncbi:hypothetical protein GCM10023161_03280 [Mycobacterium paraffinicum]|uniref:Uncharacterized protein n=1 Tax=Mycobacterium paraffinicum TaxID=53378 RepID=A0ABP8RAK1_9MYCO